MAIINSSDKLFGVGVLCYRREKETLETLKNLEKHKIKNLIILQDGSIENELIKELSRKINLIAMNNNWIYIFDGKSKGAAESAWQLFDLCSKKFKYFLFNEDDILLSENYFKYIDIFIEKKESGLLSNIVSISPFAEYRHFKDRWTKSKIFHIWGSLIESSFYQNFYHKSLSKGLKNLRKPNKFAIKLWNEILLTTRKADENIYDAQFSLALLSSKYYQIRTPLNEAIHIGYGEESTNFKNFSEEKLNADIISWSRNVLENNQDRSYDMEKIIEDKFSLTRSGINIFSLIFNYLKLIIIDFLKIIKNYF